jgi:DNA-binding NarL/FixJ family response regulator
LEELLNRHKSGVVPLFLLQNKEVNIYNTLKAITKKMHMVLPQRSNLSFASAHVQSTDAGFENTICEYLDALKVISRIKSVRKKSIIAYKAMGYCNWEIAEIMRLSESNIDWHIAGMKNILK